MAKFYEMFISFMLIGLVVVAMLGFGSLVQDQNNVDSPFMDNTLMNNSYGNLSNSLQGFRTTAQTQKDLFESENPTSGFGTILLFSIVSSGKVFNGMIVGVFNTLIKLPVVFLGLDPLIVSVLTTMLILSIIIGLWIVYKLGG